MKCSTPAGKHGVYVGIEWSYCRIEAAAAAGRKAGTVRVRGGEFDGFKISVAPGETFETPPAFVGAYRGDVDDAGNSLRKYLFNYNVPEVLRSDADVSQGAVERLRRRPETSRTVGNPWKPSTIP